jgi:hypothetical protein
MDGKKHETRHRRSENEPTARSIAAARAAQLRERTVFTRETGLRVNRDGSVRHGGFSQDFWANAQPSLSAR